MTLTTEAGIARPTLEGTWFKEGFRGTMGALLEAVENGTRPLNDARGSLDALAHGLRRDRLGADRRAGRAGRDPQPRRGGGVTTAFGCPPSTWNGNWVIRQRRVFTDSAAAPALPLWEGQNRVAILGRGCDLATMLDTPPRNRFAVPTLPQGEGWAS